MDTVSLSSPVAMGNTASTADPNNPDAPVDAGAAEKKERRKRFGKAAKVVAKGVGDAIASSSDSSSSSSSDDKKPKDSDEEKREAVKKGAKIGLKVGKAALKIAQNQSGDDNPISGGMSDNDKEIAKAALKVGFKAAKKTAEIIEEQQEKESSSSGSSSKDERKKNIKMVKKGFKVAGKVLDVMNDVDDIKNGDDLEAAKAGLSLAKKGVKLGIKVSKKVSKEMESESSESSDSSWMDADSDMDERIVNFSAFPNAEKMKYIKDSYKEDLINISENIKISKPVVFERPGFASDDCYASISHNGILAFSYRIATGYSLQFVDLLSERARSVEMDKAVLIGFYNDEAVLIRQGCPLSVIKVDSFFDPMGYPAFEDVTEVQCGNTVSDVTRLNKTRRLYFKGNEDAALYVYNVDTKECSNVESQSVSSFIETTGIDLGFNTLMSLDAGGAVFGIKEDNSVVSVGGNVPDGASVIIPSSKKPDDIDRWFTVSGFVPQTNTEFMKFGNTISLVRVWRDVFMVYDETRANWVFMRIIVP